MLADLIRVEPVVSLMIYFLGYEFFLEGGWIIGSKSKERWV